MDQGGVEGVTAHAVALLWPLGVGVGGSFEGECEGLEALVCEVASLGAIFPVSVVVRRSLWPLTDHLARWRVYIK